MPDVITPLSNPPARASAPASYVTNMDAWLASLVTMVTEINALNAGDWFDIENGSWTPVVADAQSGGNVGTAGTASGRYVRVGALVVVWFNLTNINTAGMTGGNALHIRDLPFNIENVGAFTNMPGTVRVQSITFSTPPILQGNTNSDTMKVVQQVSGGAATDITVSALSSGTADLYGCFIYRTAD